MFSKHRMLAIVFGDLDMHPGTKGLSSIKPASLTRAVRSVVPGTGRAGASKTCRQGLRPDTADHF